MNKKKIVSIHQPNYLPWLGFFKKISSSDVFVILDDVQYTKRDWRNRNKIRTSQGSQWLTVPVIADSKTHLNEVKIDYSENWNSIHKKAIFYNYSKSKYFKEFFGFFEKIYSKKINYLLELDMEIIYYLIKCLNINTEIIFSSELKITQMKSDRNLEICKKLNADIYIAGAHAHETNYLKLEDFKNNNITVDFQNFQHPAYQQCYEPFIPNMSTIDLIFNMGKQSSKILIDAKNI
jgi:hypothetical protein